MAVRPVDEAGPGYLDALRVPGAAAFSAAGGLARLPQAMVGLGSVLMVTGLGGSYTVAGAVAGAVSLTQGVVAPQVSRLIDAYGQLRVAGPQLVVFLVAVTGLVASAYRHAPAVVLLGLAVLVGAALPQIGAMARARWTHLLGGTPAALDRGLAIESLIDEAVFVVGPALVGVLATGVAPAAGLVAAMVIALVGCWLFLAQRRTEPPPAPARGRLGTRALSGSTGLRVLVGVFLGLGLLFGLLEVGIVALCRDAGQASWAGWMLALWASGSLLAGLVYGARAWHWSLVGRFLVGTAGMAAGTMLVLVASRSLPLATVALVVAGLANAPTLITGNTLVPRVSAPENLTEAYTWLTVVVFAGMAVGAAVGGAVIDAAGPPAAILGSALAGVLALATALAGRNALAPPGP